MPLPTSKPEMSGHLRVLTQDQMLLGLCLETRQANVSGKREEEDRWEGEKGGLPQEEGGRGGGDSKGH